MKYQITASIIRAGNYLSDLICRGGSMSEEIKNCSKCNGFRFRIDHNHKPKCKCQITCLSCLFSVESQLSMKSAINLWNKREG
ncbi:hypothetical protein Xind_03859 [Xenorhabdus indica]|nr:hypothetical protein [Xenorhabdus indica]